MLLRRPLRPLLVAVVCSLGFTAAARAQDNPDLATPRKTVETFVRAAAAAKAGDDVALLEALTCLDLTGISSLRDEIGQMRVRELRQIFAQTSLSKRDPSTINDTHDGGVPAGEPYVLYQDPEGVGQLELVRLAGNWRFSDYTIQIAIPDLVAAIGRRRAEELRLAQAEEAAEAARKLEAERIKTVPEWLEAKSPKALRRVSFLRLKYWQLVGLGAMVLLGSLVNKLVILLLLGITVAALKTQKMEADRELTRDSLRPFGMLAMATFWWIGLNWLGLPPKALAVVLIIVKFVTAVAGVWGAYRLVDVVCNALEKKAAKSVSKFDDLLVPLVRKSLKVFIVIFGLVFVADAMGFSISGMLTGLGLGGLAFALAAQDTVKNFFGSLTVVLDRPFEVGDWVLIDDVEGSVEEVGFRSTRVRTFYQSVISLPNAKLLTAVVDNMGKRRYRRWKTKLGVTYDTKPDTLEGFCEGIRELVRQHPCTRKDYFQVYVVGFADSAIEILLYVFFDTPDWTRELQEKQRLILDIMRLAEAMGVDFAFPTQTLHVAQGVFPGVAPAPTSGHAARSAHGSMSPATPAQLAADESAGYSSDDPTASPAMAPALEPGAADGPKPQKAARDVGRHAATSLLSRARMLEALEDKASGRHKKLPADLAIPEAGSTSSAASEEALRNAAGKNWPTSGEVSESSDDGEGGGGGGEG